MTYFLEEISLTDQEKIIQDFAQNFDANGELIYAKKDGRFPKRWAINNEKNCYLFSAPVSAVRPESAVYPYYIYVKGNIYKIYTIGLVIYFDKDISPSVLTSVELQNEIKAAFDVYGLWGTGPLDESGIPSNAVNPKIFSFFKD